MHIYTHTYSNIYIQRKIPQQAILILKSTNKQTKCYLARCQRSVRVHLDFFHCVKGLLSVDKHVQIFCS